MSTKTGLAPTDLTEFAVATKVNDGTNTSSPGLISIAYNAVSYTHLTLPTNREV